MSRRPQERHCWKICRSCYRCEKKGTSACPNPYKCSGHFETLGGHDWDDRDIDDQCRCTEGIIQLRLKSGKLVRRKLPNNPFESELKVDTMSEDERDWNAYVDETRERLDNPDWDGVYMDGIGTTNMMRQARGGH